MPIEVEAVFSPEAVEANEAIVEAPDSSGTKTEAGEASPLEAGRSEDRPVGKAGDWEEVAEDSLCSASTN
jgi:hypothetical protein